MDIPKFHETFNPILEILSNGETIHTRELQKLVAEKYFSNLTDEQKSEKTEKTQKSENKNGKTKMRKT
mgnify:CR=1 FL=1